MDIPQPLMHCSVTDWFWWTLARRADMDREPEGHAGQGAWLPAPWSLPPRTAAGIARAQHEVITPSGEEVVQKLTEAFSLLSLSAPRLVTDIDEHCTVAVLIVPSWLSGREVYVHLATAGCYRVEQAIVREGELALEDAIAGWRAGGRTGLKLRVDRRAGRRDLRNICAVHAERRRDGFIWSLLALDVRNSRQDAALRLASLYSRLELPILRAEAELCERFLRLAAPAPTALRFADQAAAVEAHARRLLARRNMFQALSLYPFLDDHLDVDRFYSARRRAARSDSWTMPVRGAARRQRIDAQAVVDAIEQGAPLIDALSRSTGLPHRIVRGLKGVQPRQDGALQVAAWLARLPRAASDVLVQVDFRSLLVHQEWMTKSIFTDAFDHIRSCDAPSLRAIFLESEDCRLRSYGGFLCRIAEWLGPRTMADAGGLPAALGHPRLREWLGLCRRWHKIETRLRSRQYTRKQGAARSFFSAPLCHGPLDIGPYRFRYLRWHDELIEEGRRMNHCLGMQERHGLVLGQHIVSIRCDGRSVATLELLCTVDPAGAVAVDVVQLVGPGNSCPDPAIVAAVRDFAGRIKQRLTELDVGRTCRPTPTPTQDDPGPFFEAADRADIPILRQYRAALQPRGGTGVLFDLVLDKVVGSAAAGNERPVSCGNELAAPDDSQAARSPCSVAPGSHGQADLHQGRARIQIGLV
jgi:hypothetical protein